MTKYKGIAIALAALLAISAGLNIRHLRERDDRRVQMIQNTASVVSQINGQLRWTNSLIEQHLEGEWMLPLETTQMHLGNLAALIMVLQNTLWQHLEFHDPWMPVHHLRGLYIAIAPWINSAYSFFPLMPEHHERRDYLSEGEIQFLRLLQADVQALWDALLVESIEYYPHVFIETNTSLRPREFTALLADFLNAWAAPMGAFAPPNTPFLLIRHPGYNPWSWPDPYSQ